MRSMQRMNGAGRMQAAPADALFARARAIDVDGGRIRSRPLGTLAEFVKTFVDRTLDVARGRYDM